MKAEIGRDVGGPSKGLLVKCENFKLTLVDQLATPGGKILAVVHITEGRVLETSCLELTQEKHRTFYECIRYSLSSSRARESRSTKYSDSSTEVV